MPGASRGGKIGPIIYGRLHEHMPVMASTSCCDGYELASMGDDVRASIRTPQHRRRILYFGPGDAGFGSWGGTQNAALADPPLMSPPMSDSQTQCRVWLQVASVVGSLGSPPVAFVIYEPHPRSWPRRNRCAVPGSLLES